MEGNRHQQLGESALICKEKPQVISHKASTLLFSKSMRCFCFKELIHAMMPPLLFSTLSLWCKLKPGTEWYESGILGCQNLSVMIKASTSECKLVTKSFNSSSFESVNLWTFQWQNFRPDGLQFKDTSPVQRSRSWAIRNHFVSQRDAFALV